MAVLSVWSSGDRAGFWVMSRVITEVKVVKWVEDDIMIKYNNIESNYNDNYS